MKRCFVTVTLVMTLALAGTASANVKVAYVDVQRALNECNAGKNAKIKFRGQIQRIETNLQRQQNSIQALKDEIEKKGMLMKPDERQNLQDEYTRKLRDFENSYKDSKAELSEKDNQMTGAIIRDLAEVIRQIGEQDGYTMIFEKGSVLWGAPAIDITEQVIRKYNAYGGKPGTLGGQMISPGRAARPSLGKGLSLGGASGGVLQKGSGGGSTITK